MPMSSDATRREFLRRTAFAAVPVACGVAGLSSAAPAPPVALPETAELLRPASFIRIRQNAKGPGWKFLKVKTASRNYPPQKDEPSFAPSRFGGDSTVNWKASGKFRVEKVEGRWWLVDPEGHPFISRGINGITPYGSSFNREAVKLMGGEKAWADEVVPMLKKNGFNTAGNWSRAALGLRQVPHDDLPYVYYGFGKEVTYTRKDAKTGQDRKVKEQMWGLMAGFVATVGVRRAVNSRMKVLPVFHPEFDAYCDKQCESLAAVKDDPWLLGYFTDNELRPASLKDYLTLNPEDKVYGATAREARRWWAQRPHGAEPVLADNVAWAAHVYDWYYGVTSRAVRKHDPNHLVLGSRLFAWERNHPEIFAAAGRHLDVISINPYGLSAVPVPRLQEWSKWSGGKPVLIGEFYVKGGDQEVGNSNGSGLVVATQEDRGLYYQNYVINLLESGVCIGWHWHRYADRRKPGVKGSEKGVNNGLVDATLNPYPQLLARTGEINLRVHEITAQVRPV